MGALADTVNIAVMLANPVAPITGAVIQQGIAVVAPRPEPTVRVVNVTATGKGTTYELALNDAKTHALNNVSGSFMISSTQTTGQQQANSAAEYSSGVIRTHEVTSSSEIDGLYTVTINAAVQVGKNNVVTSSEVNPTWRTNVNALLDEQQRQSKFVPVLGAQPAYVASITGVQVTARASYAELKIGYTVKWSQKYVDDIKTLATTAGQPINVGDPRTMYAVCFGTTAGWRPNEECRDISTSIPSVEHPLYVRIVKTYANGTTGVEVVDLRGQQNQLRVVTQPGTRFFHVQSAREVKYAKGVVIFEKGSVNGIFNIRVKLEEAANIVALEAIPTSQP